MVRAFDDQRPVSLTGMARCSADFTKTIVHSVIDDALFLCLEQEHGRRILRRASQHLFTGENTLSHPVVGRPADAQLRIVSIAAQVSPIAYPAMSKHVNAKRQRMPAPRAYS